LGNEDTDIAADRVEVRLSTRFRVWMQTNNQLDPGLRNRNPCCLKGSHLRRWR